ncbi:MAG: hypothetical protein IJK79_05435 [Bacteroidales bacterium]|nr:hypothetical protein [Bacteroidales bacterium]
MKKIVEIYKSYNPMKKPSLKKFKDVVEACGGNITAIAKAFGCYRATIYHWAENPEFRAIIDEYRGRLFDEALEAARQLAIGVPKRDDEGNLLGWIERPEPQTVRYLLGVLGRREGFGEETTVKANVSFESLTDAQLDEMARRLAREIKTEEEGGEPEETARYGRDITNTPLELDEI